MSIKKKVMPVSDRHLSKASIHVIIERDQDCPNPLKDYEQVFLLHSNIRDVSGNEDDKDYPNPLVEIEDEDGYGTGTFRFRDGVVHFPVSAYIHSGVALRMGSIREFPCDPGGWDTTKNAAYMWTDKERFEKLCCKDGWMTIYDEETESRRPAKDEAEFRQYLWEIAKDELKLFQKYLDGECFRYREEIREPFKKVYPDGTEEDACDWIDDDSCGGFYADSIDDIDFSKDEDIDVFDDTGRFVGDEWTIPELVIQHPETGFYLLNETWKQGDGSPVPAVWTRDLEKAKVYRHWNCAYNAMLEDGTRLWNVFGDYKTVRAKGIIKDKDELRSTK